MEENELLNGLKKVAENALGYWNLEGQLSLIKHRENAVYEVNTGDSKYAMRVHRQGYHDDGALRSEWQWMEALEAAGIGVPRVVRTTDGNDFVKVGVAALPGEYQVDQLGWIEGEQIGDIETGLGDGAAECYRIIGRVAAQMHNQASVWQLPDGFVRHAWDIDGLVGDAPFWGRFWELNALTDEQLALIHRAREMVAEGLTAFGQAPEDYSMIHADFVPENFLRHGDNVQVIDFDDAGFGWHLFDLATALYFIQEDPSFEEAKAALIEGYREHRDLPDEKLSKLPLFTAARSFTYLGWVHTREDTQAAVEMTPVLVDMCCAACEALINEGD